MGRRNISNLNPTQLRAIYEEIVLRSQSIRTSSNPSEILQDIGYTIKCNQVSKELEALCNAMTFTYRRFLVLKELFPNHPNRTWTDPYTVGRANLDELFSAINSYFDFTQEASKNDILEDFLWNNIAELDPSISVEAYRDHQKPDVMKFYSDVAQYTEFEIDDSYHFRLNDELSFMVKEDSAHDYEYQAYSSLFSVILRFNDNSFIWCNNSQVTMCVDGDVYVITRSLDEDYNLKEKKRGNQFISYNVFMLFSVTRDGEATKKRESLDTYSGFTAIKDTKNYMLHVRNKRFDDNNPFSLSENLVVSNIGFVNGEMSHIGVSTRGAECQSIVISGAAHFCNFKLFNADLITHDGEKISYGLVPQHMTGKGFFLGRDDQEELKQLLESSGFNPEEDKTSRYDLCGFFLKNLIEIPKEYGFDEHILIPES